MAQVERMIPVDPEAKGDSYQRYKMPAIAVKIEGNGNGIKTVFPNLHDVCAVINRPEPILLSFFQFELGTQKISSQKDDKFIVMGQHTQDRIQEKVYQFITRFVLCKHCRNPQTTVSVDQRGTVKLTCEACGKLTPINPGERAYSLFGSFYKLAKEDKKALTTTAAAASTTPAAATAVPVTTAPPPPASATTDQQQQYQPVPAKQTSHIAGGAVAVVAGPNPAEVLAIEMKKDPQNAEAHVRATFEVRTQFNLEPKHMVRTVFRAIVSLNETKPIAQLQQSADLLARFCLMKDRHIVKDETQSVELENRERELQDTLMSECELFCAKLQPHKMPILLKALFESGVLVAKSVEHWLQGKSAKSIPPEQAEKMRKMTEPLVQWLNGQQIA